MKLLFSIIFLYKGSNKPLLDVVANLMPANLIISVPSGILLQIYPFNSNCVSISVCNGIQPSKSRRKMKRIKSFFPLHLIVSFPTTCVAVIGLESYLYSNAWFTCFAPSSFLFPWWHIIVSNRWSLLWSLVSHNLHCWDVYFLDLILI